MRFGIRSAVAISHIEAGRYIPSKIYRKLKAKTTCSRCGKKVNLKKERLEIHHIVRVIDGGSNQENNLRAVCKSCHKVLDDIEFVKGLKPMEKEDIDCGEM